MFKHGGLKLTDAEEGTIENSILSPQPCESENIANIVDISEKKQAYIQFLSSMFPKWKQNARILTFAKQAAVSGKMVFAV